ncbi:MAG: tyrosine-type recombinase/integrase [Verrucomicrobiaceae bacterium]
MRKRNPDNEKIKWQYLRFLEDAKRMKPESVDQVAAAIAAFEQSTGWKDFRLFHVEQARKFKRDLDSHAVADTGKPLAVATKVSRLRALKAFFQWLSDRPGYSRKLAYSDMEYFNPSNNDGRIAGAVRERPIPTVEQINHVLASMPTSNVIERRNRALVAFTILTGARDAAISSMLLKHVDLERRTVFQDAREVKTKNRKTFTSWFFPVGEHIYGIVRDWIDELKNLHLFGPADPLFPATERKLDTNNCFHASGITRLPWASAGPIRAVFKSAFIGAGLPYFHPHTFRKTIWKLGEIVCRNGREARAWSLNLGHDNVLTSFSSYGPMTGMEREDVMNQLAKRLVAKPANQGRGGEETELDPDLIRRVLVHLQKTTSPR